MTKFVWSVRKKVILAAVHAALAVIILLAIIFLLKRSNEQQEIHKAAVVTNGVECSAIASQILKEGGSAADATISTLLCEETNKVETLIARDVAPMAATEDMFVNITVTGGKAVAVPGELKGYWELHQKYGKLPWSRLFEPVIELCRKGHVVSPYLAGILIRKREMVRASPTLRNIYFNPETNDVYQQGDFVKRNKLADTLEIIKTEGVNSIYNGGKIGLTLIEDIQAAGGIMTIDDLKEYNVRWEEPISADLKDNKKLHTVPLPGSGALVAFILNVLNDYLPEEESVTSLQRIAETVLCPCLISVDVEAKRY